MILISGKQQSIKIKVELSNPEFEKTESEASQVELEKNARKFLSALHGYWKLHDMNTTICSWPEATSDAIYSFSPKHFEQMDKLLQWKRDIYDIIKGSIIINMIVPTVESLDDLWRMYNNKELKNLLESILITGLKNKFHLTSLGTEVTISEEDYNQVKRVLRKRPSPSSETTRSPQQPGQHSIPQESEAKPIIPRESTAIAKPSQG